VSREPLENAPCGGAVPGADAVKRFADGRLDRAGTRAVDAMASRAESKNCAPAIVRVVQPQQQPL
jgi:hypothetical protein